MPANERRKPNYSRRLTWLGVVIVLLFGGYSAAWFYVAAKLEAVAGAAIAGLNHGGTSADCTNPAARGFPFRIGLYCDGLRYANTDEKVGASAAAFRSAAQVYDPMHIVAELDSPARISGPGGSAITFDWGNLRASARLTTDFPEQLSAEVVKLSAAAEAAGPGALATIGQAQAHMRRSGDDLDLAASFDGADIDPKLLGGADLPPFEGAADLTIKDGVNLARFGGSLRGHSGTIRTLSISSGGTAGLSVAGPFSVDDGRSTPNSRSASAIRRRCRRCSARRFPPMPRRSRRASPALPRSATTRRCRSGSATAAPRWGSSRWAKSRRCESAETDEGCWTERYAACVGRVPRELARANQPHRQPLWPSIFDPEASASAGDARQRQHLANTPHPDRPSAALRGGHLLPQGTATAVESIAQIKPVRHNLDTPC